MDRRRRSIAKKDGEEETRGYRRRVETASKSYCIL